MGRFLAIVIALSGCGRLGFDDMNGGGGGSGGSGDQSTGPGVSASQLPNVCDSRSWAINSLGGNLDLAVTATATGAAVFAVPTATGSISGFLLNENLESSGLTTVAAGTFISSAASVVDGKLIVAGVNGGSRALVYIAPSDLGTAASQIANVDGMYLSKSPLLTAGTDLITPTACSAGLTINPYDTQFNATASQLSVTTAQSTALVSTPYGPDVMAVWSTATDCHLEHLTGWKTGTGSSQSYACSAPAIATNGTTGMLLFEGSGGVHTAGFDGSGLDGSHTLFAPGASSPRVMFAGSLYWISYLDGNGDLNVGYLSSTGALLTATVTGTQPAHDAYQFLDFNGEIWVISADATSFAATKICIGS